MFISLDIALAVSGCEAIVERFYSLMNAHKKGGGQSNEVLVNSGLEHTHLFHAQRLSKLLQSSTLEGMNSIICQNFNCLSLETLEREQITMKLAKLLIELRMNSQGVNMCYMIAVKLMYWNLFNFITFIHKNYF